MTKDQMRDILGYHCDHDACRTCQLAQLTEGWCRHYSHVTIPDDKVEQAYIETFGKLPVDDVEEVVIEEEEEEATEDVVNHPNHYTNGGMECIDEMILIFGKEATAHFCLLNAWKYRRRAVFKNGEQDIDKSHWYVAKYKELTEGRLDELVKELKHSKIQTIDTNL
jgi:hypothetical protein